MKQQAWNVYLGKKLIDTVFYDNDCDKWYVYSGLVNHDGYDPNISIIKQRRKSPVNCYDNGGSTFDRYTIVFKKLDERGDCVYLAASTYPFHPQGFGQHGSARGRIDLPTWKHLGKRIRFSELPEDVQKFVNQNL